MVEEDYEYVFTHTSSDNIIQKIYSISMNVPVPHRLNGPAIEFSDGRKLWYYKGKRVKCSSQEEFEKTLKLKAFW